MHKITNYTQGICCDRTGDKGWVLLHEDNWRLDQSQKWCGYIFCKLVTAPIKGKSTTYTANGYRSVLYHYPQISRNLPVKFKCNRGSLNSGRHGHMPAVSMKGARRDGGGLWAVDLPDMAACLGVIGCQQYVPAMVSICKNWYIQHGPSNSSLHLRALYCSQSRLNYDYRSASYLSTSYGSVLHRAALLLFFQLTKKIENTECVHHEQYLPVREVILSKLSLDFKQHLGSYFYPYFSVPYQATPYGSVLHCPASKLFFLWTKKIEKIECVHTGNGRYLPVREVILSKLSLEFTFSIFIVFKVLFTMPFLEPRLPFSYSQGTDCSGSLGQWRLFPGAIADRIRNSRFATSSIFQVNCLHNTLLWCTYKVTSPIRSEPHTQL